MGQLRPARQRPADLARGVSALALAALIVGGVAALAGGGVAALYQGAFTSRQTAAELSALLRPYYRVHLPEGAAGRRLPTAILVPGCVGAYDHADDWARHLAAQGWAAVVVDSHGPRGWNRPEFLQRICTGRMFWGTARAGDVLVALEDVRREPFADPDRLALVGWSHGGWAVMDLLALDPPRRRPFNLADLPEGFAERGFAGVAGVALFYPYCAIGNRARRSGWRHRAEVLFILAGADTIIRNETCLAAAASLRRGGLPVEVATLEGVNHGFDDTFTFPGSPLIHDPAATSRAKEVLAGFLRGLTAQR